MERQLTLLPSGNKPARSRRTDWRLDEHTRKVGRKGVAEAREILKRNPPKTAA